MMTDPLTIEGHSGGLAVGHERSVLGRLGFPLVLLVTVVFLVLGGIEAWNDSATFDEPVYVSSGLAGVLHHDVADNAEHPPLFKVLAALPILVVHPVIPADGSWDVNNERAYSSRFVEAQIRAGTMHRVTFAARLVPLLESALLALALYALASLLFGTWAGVVAALLWLIDPLVLGVGHLDGVDIPFALTTVLFSLSLVRWLRGRDRRSLLWLGVACGAVASAQATGLLLVALAVVTVVLAGRGERRLGNHYLRQAGVVALVAWVFVWAVYLMLDPSVLVHSWVVLPQPYIDGIRYLSTHDTGAAPGYLLGVAWSGANVWFWPATLLVKVSTPILVVLVAGTLSMVQLARSGRISRSAWYETVVVVLLPAALLFVLELPNPRTLGVRYLLPSIALWAVAASPIAVVAARRSIGLLLAALITVSAVVTAGSFPHSIAYSAPPFRPAYAVATDSNVDWGQDFTLLTAWSRGRSPFVAYFGPRGITDSDIPGAHSLIGTPPGRISGWVAASATDLTSADRVPLAWLRGYCPVGTLGGSILLYHFISHPTGAPGPTAPPNVCPGAASHRVGRGGAR